MQLVSWDADRISQVTEPGENLSVPASTKPVRWLGRWFDGSAPLAEQHTADTQKRVGRAHAAWKQNHPTLTSVGPNLNWRVRIFNAIVRSTALIGAGNRPWAQKDLRTMRRVWKRLFQLSSAGNGIPTLMRRPISTTGNKPATTKPGTAKWIRDTWRR